MTTTDTPRPRWISTTDTAKLIRGTLRSRFPGVKFSVRSSKYAGGSSVHVDWTDGPTVATVERVVGGFAGGGFDGMIDGSYRKTGWLCPVHGAAVAEIYGHGQGFDGPCADPCCGRVELVNYSPDYVITHRDYSPAARAMLEGMAAAREGFDAYDPHQRLRNGDGWMTEAFHRLAYVTPLAIDSDGAPVIVAADAAALVPPAAAPATGEPGSPAWLAAQRRRVDALTARMESVELRDDAWSRLHTLLTAAQGDLARWTA